MSQNFYYPNINVPTYPNAASLPIDASDGSLAVTTDTDTVYVFNAMSSTWVAIGGSSVPLGMGAFDGQPKANTGASIAMNMLFMQSADATHPGLVNTGAQTFAGAKTFTGAISASNLSGTNTGDITLGTANGLSLVGQALSLGLSSSSTIGALSSADWTTFNSKQPLITPGTTLQYYRGDKTFQTLDTSVVPENGNLYFTNPRAQTAIYGTSIYQVGPGLQYTTIQAALNAIGNATSSADLKQPKLVMISPGVYDEDLTIPNGRIITLQAQGTVILGNGAGANWSSTNSRSITVTFNNADVFGSDVKPALNIISIPATDTTSTFIAESGMFAISGNLNVNGDGLTNTVSISNVKLYGNFVHNTSGLTNWMCYRSLFIGTITTTGDLVLERAYDSRFNSLVSINAYNMVANCNFLAGMTVQSIQQNLLPNGMFFTNFSGTFTGPASSLRLDVTSDYYFRTNGASLGGSATKTLLASLASATVTGVLSNTDWSTFNSKQAALTPGSISTSTTGVTVGNGASSTVGPNVTVDVQTASGSQPGLLSSADWTTFNNKQPAGSYVTSVTGSGNIASSGGTTPNITFTGILPIANGGTNASSASTAFNNLSPMTTLGDIIYGGASGIGTRLGIGSANQVLQVSGGIPSWQTITLSGVATIGTIDSQAKSADGLVIATSFLYAQTADASFPGMVSTGTQTFAGNKTFTGAISASNLSGTNTGDQTITLTGDVTGSGTGSFAATIANNAVTNAKLAQMPTLTIKGNNTGGTANALDLTVSQVNTMLGDILANGTVAFTADQSMGTHKLTNVLDPTSAQDAATKAYVDTVASQLNPKQAVYAASTANIVGTYTNGVGGIGSTFTVTATGAFTIDGTTPPQSSRILIKDQTSGFQDGIYDLTVTGSLGVSPILTRSLDYDTATDMNAGDLIPVINGTVNAGTTWLQTATITTVGTDSLVFVQWSASAASYLRVSNNLSDVASTSTSFNNISPLTTKGDILAYSTTNARLPVGSNGQVLTADSAQTLGVKWATPTTGTVTSVALTVPSFLSVSGSPITSSGTLAVTLSGTALPVANGGTGDTSTTAYGVLTGGTTSTGAFQNAGTGTSGQVLTSNGSSALPTWNSPLRTINAQSGTTYTFVLSDGSGAGGDPLVTFGSGSATTVTVPTNASVAFPVGTQIDCIQQGAGKVTFAGAGGVTVNSAGSFLSIASQYTAVSLIKTATDTWTLIGNLIA